MTKTLSLDHAHHFPIRVYYEDTDAGGVVYHANFLNFTLRARTEYLREMGHDQGHMIEELKVLLVVRHIDADYRSPAKLDDLLDVETTVKAFGNTSLTVNQTVRRGETVLAVIKTVLVAINAAGKATRVPPQLRQIFGE